MLRHFKLYLPDDAGAGKNAAGEDEKDLLIKDDDDQAGKTGDLDKDKADDKIQDDKETDKTDDDDLELKSGKDLSLEDYEENLQKIRTKIEGKKSDEAAKVEVKDKDKDKKADEDKTKIADEDILFDPGDTTDLDKDKDESKKPKLISVTDEYITSQPEEHQEILRSIKGKQADPQVIKNYIHKELLIRKLKSDGEAKPDKETDSKFKLDDSEVGKQRTSYLFRNMKEKFPDLTEEVFADEESLEEFLSDMQSHSPVKARKFLDNYSELGTSWDKRLGQFKHYAENWEEITKAQAVTTVQSFNEHIKKRGLTAKDLGVKYTESWLMDNVIAPNGKPDTDIVSYLDSQGTIPVVNEKMLLRKLKEKYEDVIIDTVAQKAGEQALIKRSKHEADPSISVGGNMRRTERKEPLEKKISPDMPLEEMDKILNEQKKAIIGD